MMVEVVGKVPLVRKIGQHGARVLEERAPRIASASEATLTQCAKRHALTR